MTTEQRGDALDILTDVEHVLHFLADTLTFLPPEGDLVLSPNGASGLYYLCGHLATRTAEARNILSA